MKSKRKEFLYLHFLCIHLSFFPAVVESRFQKRKQRDEKNEFQRGRQRGVWRKRQNNTKIYFKKLVRKEQKLLFRVYFLFIQSSEEHFYNVLFLSVLYSSRNFSSLTSTTTHFFSFYSPSSLSRCLSLSLLFEQRYV